MERFEDVTRELTEGLELSKKARRRIADEARAHLEDEMQRCLADGMGEDEAQAEAVRRFGEAGALNGLIDSALARHQQRRRRVRRALVVAGLLAFVFVVGAVFRAFDDGLTSVDAYRLAPRWAKMTAYLVGIGLCAGMLVGVAVKLFGRRFVPALIAGVVVGATMFGSLFVFGWTPFLDIYRRIDLGERAATVAAQSFFMRLYLCWAVSLFLGALCIVLRRDRATAVLLAGALGVGVLSALLRTMEMLPLNGRYVHWLHLHEWSDLASMALFALVYVLLVAMLSRAMTRRRFDTPTAEAASDAAMDPSPSPS